MEDSTNKINNNLWRFFSWFGKPSTITGITNDPNSSQIAEYKELNHLIEKLDVVEASKLPPEIPENSLQSFKLKRLESINKGEVQRIYELKNYKYIKLSEIRAADEIEILQKETERQKIDPNVRSSKL